MSDALQEHLRGTVVTPADAAYEEARKVRNAMYERRPAAIVQCAGVPDVQHAIRHAREHELPIAVRCGNHSVHGHGSCDGGIVLDLHTFMRGVWVDPKLRIARAQGGADWGDFDGATQLHGLATTGGRVSDTGIGGLTLGSGSGWLERKLGLTCDNLIGAELVTADGELVRVDEHEHRDLLWGLRGGGGNFGVVTVFEYRVDPVGPIVLGGNLVYPADRGLEVISAWQELVDSASDDLGTGIHFYVMPDIPYVPAELRNQPVVSIFVCHAGTVEEAEREIAPLRDLSPAADMLEPMPYTTVQALSDAVLPPGQRNYWKAENLTDLTIPGITALISGAVDLAVTSPLGVVALYPKGRAITQVDADSAALDGRASPYSVYAWSLWPSAEDDELNIGRTRSLFNGIAEHLDTGVSANFSSEQDATGFRQSFGRAERYQRLVDLKRRFDPENVFHLNHNIDPAAALQPAGDQGGSQ